MATVTFTFGPKTKNYTVTAPNLIRLQNWATAAYPTIPNPAYNPALPTDPVTNPVTITNPDPVGSAIDAVWAGIRANIIGVEKATAVAAVPTPGDVN